LTDNKQCTASQRQICHEYISPVTKIELISLDVIDTDLT